ncbi:hypothetical protein B0T16DRAFT_451395 [Cercophora newfieldiana]|uniref:Conidiation-specific protein 8 n=1 Tax=Cercophora newfieldiana TaxID=92897 RepID=A0AA40CY17_9PEZI|nr:hypothetical protein B0T16DRAFT_451395 [Cercophora newfieldiana]
MTDTTDSSFVPRTERSDSTSSASSAGSASTPRRASHGGLFEGLQNQKRRDDPASIARRQSMNEQRPKSGFIGQMWNNWVHGPPDTK